MKSKISVIRDKTLCFLMQHTGLALAFFCFVIALAGFANYFTTDDLTGVKIVLPFVFAGLGALGIMLFIRGRRIRRLLTDFRLFASILAKDENKSVEKIASAVNQPLDTVMKKADAMCRRHYFTGYLDHGEKRLVFDSDASAAVIRCPGCGAPARVEGSNTVCAYCGSPLTAEN